MARCSKGTLLLYNPKAPRDERYVFIEDTCRRITCPDCVHKAAKRLEGNIAVYARQDRLHYFITITTSLEETEAAIIELQAMWTGIRRDMGNLHYETYRRYRQSRDKAKFNENTGSARWKSIIGNYIQDDISYSCDNLMRSQFNFAFASQHGVYLKKLPESAQRAFLNEHRSELDELFPMYKQNVGLTDADKQRVIDRVQAMYRNVLAQSIGPIKFVRVIERGENGHLHFHILCNYPLPHGIHLKHSTVTSQIYNVQYAALNQNSEDPNLAAISAYISKMAHYASKFIHFIHDIGDHVIVTGSNGYELLTDEPRDKSLQYVDFINGLEIPDGSMAVSYKQMRAMSKGNIGQEHNLYARDVYTNVLNHVPAQYKDEGSKRIRNALYIWNHIETDEALPESEPNQFLSNRLSAEQRHAVSKVGVSKYNLVLGPAGTGKTTIIPSILTAYNIPPNKVLIAAFTGRAVEILRQKLPNRYHNSVMTVHKSLKYQEGSGFRRGYNNVIPDIEWLFVDEIGILQFYVFARLLQSIPEHTRIVMLGDERQLSSRDGENLAYDLQMVRNINVLHLAENHRSNDVVLAAAHDVLRGRLPPYEPINIKQLATLALEGWQVITNVKRVSNEVNVAVLSRLPSRVPIELRNGFYAVGDRIMFKHNDYHYGFRNGEIGTIGSHDGLGNLFIRTPHKLYELPLDLLIRYPVIEHGYANTVNKFQGSEFDRVAIAIADLRVDLDEKNAQVSQNLLYTALTRAKYEFALFADDEAIELCRHRDMRSPVMDWARDSIEHCARIGVPINATFAEMVAKIDENCAE